MDSDQAKLELHIIKKIIDDSRKSVIDNGWHYIFWGITITIALIINYIMILYKASLNFQGLLWLFIIIAAYIISFIIEMKHKKTQKVKTFAGTILSSLWIAAGISMIIFGFIGTLTNAYSPIYICPIISVVLGLAYFASGTIQQENWLKYISFGWWIGAVFMFVFPGVHTLLVFAFMLICFQTIPGIFLNRKFKKFSTELNNV